MKNDMTDAEFYAVRIQCLEDYIRRLEYVLSEVIDDYNRDYILEEIPEIR